MLLSASWVRPRDFSGFPLFNFLYNTENGATVTFLLRNPKCFDADEFMKPYIATGKARLVPGNALKEDDVREAWKVATEQGAKVDTVLYTLGEYLSCSRPTVWSLRRND